ncbi:MAG TPA: SUMF1/EgtB/PvdO family nonheme iron enzyme, partial [Kofleriaceae bacterium]|nr:SUMF1/EgtB/PvdO family nonheme iron enzyme [Kofleriaceae bacterium]
PVVDAQAPPPPDALEVPAGMLLVTMKAGERLLVDAKPISLADYRAVFAKHAQTGKPEDAVVGVSYTEAKSFALTKGRRLLTTAEWDAAAVTAGFIVADGRWEWVDSPDDKKKTVRQHGKTATRADAKAPDVTFRTAKSI